MNTLYMYYVQTSTVRVQYTLPLANCLACAVHTTYLAKAKQKLSWTIITLGVNVTALTVTQLQGSKQFRNLLNKYGRAYTDFVKYHAKA